MNYLFNPKNRVKESEAILIIVLLLDLQQDFRLAVKRSIMKFLLRQASSKQCNMNHLLIQCFFPLHSFIVCQLHDSYKDQRNHMTLEMNPSIIEFPIATIRGPVSWKCNFQLATNRLDQVLMANHPVLQAINHLWYEL